MAALALATERPSEALLEREPYGKTDNLITNTMWKMILGQAFFQLIVNLTILYYGHVLFGVEKDGVIHLTIMFNIFVLCQLFNEINARRIYDEMNIFSNFFNNPIFIGVMIFTLGAQYLIVQYGGEFTATHPLTGQQWLICFGVGFISIPYGFVLRLIKVAEPPKGIIAPPKKSVTDKWRRARGAAAAEKKLEKNTLFTLLRGSRAKQPVKVTDTKKKQ